VDKIIEIIAQEKDEGARLDLFLSAHTSITRSHASRLISDGLVNIEKAKAKPSLKIKPGMKISITMKEPEPSLHEAQDIPLKIIYEDRHIIVIDKPAGLVVHPGAGCRDHTLVNALLNHCPEIAHVGSRERPGIVHRLDKLTSGVMVAAKTYESYQSLSTAFSLHAHKREYLAICYGHMPKDNGSIETLLNRHPKDRKKMSSKVTRGRQAITHWKVQKEWDELSFLSLSLETGRTHQIRVHLSDMGNPIAGDPEYGGKRRANSIKDSLIRAHVKDLSRQMLHAHKLGIHHPVTKEWMEFKSDPPEDMKDLIAFLDSHYSLRVKRKA
jgi:23S rRNA pseudouridine1911/1915/1917 synthase